MANKVYFPIIISSPSGGGKSSVCDKILLTRNDFVYSVSYTTRPQRVNEKDGVDYHFVSENKFYKMIDNNEFIEWAKVHNYLYGTSEKVVRNALDDSQFVIMDIDTEGSKKFVKKIPETLSIFLFPPSMRELERRLRNRNTDDEKTIALRLKNARKEFADAWIYDIFFINDDLDKVVNKIIKVIDLKCLNKLEY